MKRRVSDKKQIHMKYFHRFKPLAFNKRLSSFALICIFLVSPNILAQTSSIQRSCLVAFKSIVEEAPHLNNRKKAANEVNDSYYRFVHNQLIPQNKLNYKATPSLEPLFVSSHSKPQEQLKLADRYEALYAFDNPHTSVKENFGSESKVENISIHLRGHEQIENFIRIYEKHQSKSFGGDLISARKYLLAEEKFSEVYQAGVIAKLSYRALKPNVEVSYRFEEIETYYLKLELSKLSEISRNKNANNYKQILMAIKVIKKYLQKIEKETRPDYLQELDNYLPGINLEANHNYKIIRDLVIEKIKATQDLQKWKSSSVLSKGIRNRLKENQKMRSIYLTIYNYLFAQQIGRSNVNYSDGLILDVLTSSLSIATGLSSLIILSSQVMGQTSPSLIEAGTAITGLTLGYLFAKLNFFNELGMSRYRKNNADKNTEKIMSRIKNVISGKESIEPGEWVYSGNNLNLYKVTADRMDKLSKEADLHMIEELMRSLPVYESFLNNTGSNSKQNSLGNIFSTYDIFFQMDPNYNFPIMNISIRTSQTKPKIKRPKQKKKNLLSKGISLEPAKIPIRTN